MPPILTRLKQLPSRLAADPSGLFFQFADGRRLIWLSRLCGITVRFSGLMRGVKIGSGVAFYGRTLFRRTYKSKIIIGKNCRFRSAFISNSVGLNRKCFLSTLEPGAELSIGDNSGFSGTVIGCGEKIVIGKNIICGGNTFITDSDWHSLDRSNPAAKALTAPVVIEDNVWLGLNSVVLKGVTIGKGSIIGANSVVTKSIPSGVIAAGNPCKVVKEINTRH